jgi:DNA repair protein RadA/Sms
MRLKRYKAETRIKEAAKLGFSKGIVPVSNARILEGHGIEIIGVKNVEEAIEILFY